MTSLQSATPERLLLRLEWRVLRRIDGRIQGSYRTPYRGSGMDFAGLREYLETDDARHIDWNATARLNSPQVRQFVEDRDLTVWLVLDQSASMAAGAPGRGKHDVLAELTLTLARLFGRGGNRVGALLHDGETARIVPPGAGRAHALRIGHELERPHRKTTTTPTDFAAMLDATATMARRRSLIIVISDFIGTGDWDKQLLRLVHRHDVVALRVMDASDDELPDAGLIVVEDAETGEQLIVDSSDPLFRARYRAGVDERDSALAQTMHRGKCALASHRHRPRSGRGPGRGRGEHPLAARMTISSPWWLVLGGLVVAALVVAAVISTRRRRAALIAAGVGADSRGRRFSLGLWLSIAGIAVLAVAVAGPAASVPVTRAAGTVIIAMDVSNSMAATDVDPNRLAAAKKAATAFVNAQPSSVDVGVVAFQTGGADHRPTQRRSCTGGRGDRAAADCRRYVLGGRDPDLAVGDHRQGGIGQ